MPFVLAHRERLVLKPNDDYGGEGIVLGWTVDDAGLGARRCATALAEPYIVQERVALPDEPYPSLVDGQVRDRRPHARHRTVRRATASTWTAA